MKALVFTAYGVQKEHLLVSDFQQAVMSPGQLLLKVHAASLNPVDVKMVKGQYKAWSKAKFPEPLGHDFCAEVLDCAEGSAFSTGERVYGCLPAGAHGSIATHCVADEKCLVPCPEGWESVEAAALPLTGMTTLQCFDAMKLKSGDRVLIHAGSGGVGSIAIQLAKQLGAFVYTTTSSKNAAWVEALGADRVICYDREDYTAICSDLDAVLDTLGGEHTYNGFRMLRRGGHLVSIVGRPDHNTAKQLGLSAGIRAFLWFSSRKVHWKAWLKGVSYTYVLMQTNQSDLDRLTQLVQQGQLKPVIEKVYSLEESPEAVLHQNSGRVKGKLVIQMPS